jgi:hypothetical protein|tara:strand:+ start:1953 stop:2198 length:246 start_codon:yes stop_codon:yes gene_type:complete
MAEQIASYWPQVLAIVSIIVMFVKLKTGVAELRKDVDDINKRDTYMQVVKLRADLDALKNNTDEKIKSLFTLWNTKLFKDE